MTLTVGTNIGILCHGDEGEEHYDALMAQFRWIDFFLEPVVKARIDEIPTGLQTNGDAYILLGAPYPNAIIRYTEETPAYQWEAKLPKHGWEVVVAGELDTSGVRKTYQFDGTQWVEKSQEEPSSENFRIAGEDISALRVVWEDSDGKVYKLNQGDTQHWILIAGVTATGGLAGDSVKVVQSGVLDTSGLALAPGSVWVGTDGMLTQTPPTSGMLTYVGAVMSNSRLIVKTSQSVIIE
jgi:hypothetical protein